MKRTALLVAPLLLALGIFTSSASAAPGGTTVQGAVHATSRITRTVTEFEANYNASEYYGEVHCIGKHIISNTYPNGKDAEQCFAVTPPLVHMIAGKGQTQFENSSGGFVTEWSSDYNAVATSNFTYTVSKTLSKFRIVAIY